MAYVFAPAADRPAASSSGAMVVRFFFSKQSSVVEDPGTGSACANLGGWLLANGAPLPQSLIDRAGRCGRATLPDGRCKSVPIERYAFPGASSSSIRGTVTL